MRITKKILEDEVMRQKDLLKLADKEQESIIKKMIT